MNRQKGFTLVELSIVLVILGLLVGGVLTGQSLIRAAELRSIATEFARFQTAVNTFKDKYFAIPGDMPNAVAYWGQAPVCRGNASQGATDSKTCNGDGDGRVIETLTSSEQFRFWQHLASAGLIEGTYSGVTGADAYWWTATPANSPRSKLQNALWATVNIPDNTSAMWSSDLLYSASMGNVMTLGGATASGPANGLIITPAEAYNVDMKMDDGKPLQGKMLAVASAACDGVSNGSSPIADYALSGTAKSCSIYFQQVY